MKLGLTSLILAAAAMDASAYNVAGIVGAWAPAEDSASNAVLVVEHHAAWAKKDGGWRPFLLGEVGSNIESVGVTLIPIDGNGKPAYSVEKSDTETGCVVLAARSATGERGRCRKLVRTNMPDWDKVCDSGGYVGTWTEASNPLCALVVRKEGTAAVVPVVETPDDGSGRETSVEYDWRRDCAGIRLFDRSDDNRKLLPDHGFCVMSLRPDGKSADIVCPPYFNGVVVRSAAKVSDPAERRRKMASDGTYHGMWVLDDLENGYSFYISPKGRGLLVSMKLGPEHILPFVWKAPPGGGKVHCTLMPRFSAGTQCWFSEFDFEYNPETNEVGLAIPPDGKDGEREPTRATLKFFNWNEMVDQVIKSLDEAKKR